MNRSVFWDIIRVTRPQQTDCAKHIDNLTQHLITLPRKEIASFAKHLLDLQDEAYDARLLEVLWILTGGGPGDEGLFDFTDWLVLQGRKRFEQILKAPERLPEFHPAGESIYCNGLSHIADSAYKDSTGRDDFYEFCESIYGAYELPEAPRGADQDPRLESEDILEKRLRVKYPDLWQYEGEYD